MPLRYPSILLVTLLLGTAVIASADPASIRPSTLLDAEGQQLPFASWEEIENFLATAPVAETKLLGKGSTGVLKVTLDDGETRAHAVFRNVDETFNRRSHGTRPDRYARRDFHLFEVAAYRIDRLLGLERVPPTVRREIDGREGSLQLWIQNAMTAAELREEGRTPYMLTYHQQQIMRAFDVIVGNWDRHLNNELYDQQGRLWFIDHTRSFLLDPTPTGIAGLTSTEDDLLHTLRELDAQSFREALAGVLGRLEADAVARRAHAVKEHFEDLISERGADSVLFDLNQVARAAQQNREQQDRMARDEAPTSPLSQRLAAHDSSSRDRQVTIGWPSARVEILL